MPIFHSAVVLTAPRRKGAHGVDGVCPLKRCNKWRDHQHRTLNLLVEEVWTCNFLDGVTSTSLFTIYLSDDSTVEPAGALEPRPVETVPVQSISTENASRECLQRTHDHQTALDIPLH